MFVSVYICKVYKLHACRYAYAHKIRFPSLDHDRWHRGLHLFFLFQAPHGGSSERISHSRNGMPNCVGGRGGPPVTGSPAAGRPCYFSLGIK